MTEIGMMITIIILATGLTIGMVYVAKNGRKRP